MDGPRWLSAVGGRTLGDQVQLLYGLGDRKGPCVAESPSSLAVLTSS